MTYQAKSDQLLTVNTLNIDNLRIDTMELHNNGKLLIIGIENFGILIYDVETSKLIRS